MNAHVLSHLQHAPRQFWTIVVVTILAIIAIKIALAYASSGNKVFMAIVLCTVVALTITSWTYNRDEPHWATPLIKPIANSGFLPTKGAYALTQQKTTLPGTGGR